MWNSIRARMVVKVLAGVVAGAAVVVLIDAVGAVGRQLEVTDRRLQRIEARLASQSAPREW